MAAQCSSTIDTAGSRAYRITDTTMENFANVVYASSEFSLSNRLFQDSPGFGEHQEYFHLKNISISRIYLIYSTFSTEIQLYIHSFMLKL